VSDNNQSSKLSQKGQKKPFPKKYLFIIIGFVAVGIVLLIFWYLNFYLKDRELLRQETEALAQMQVETEKATKSQEVYFQAVEKVESGDYASGQVILDTAVASTNDSIEQAWIYIQKASIALNANQFEDAYNFAKEAEELDPSVSSARLLAAAVEAKGNKVEALENYQLSLSRINGDSELDELDREEVRGYIRLLQS